MGTVPSDGICVDCGRPLLDGYVMTDDGRACTRCMVPRQTTEDLITTFAAKATVQYERTRWKASRARRALEARGVVLPAGIDTAISHALDSGEGRGEFDTLMAEWRAAR